MEGIERGRLVLMEFAASEINEVSEEDGSRAGVGFRAHAAYDGDGNRIAYHDGGENRTDLSALGDREGHTVVAVSASEEGSFHWVRFTLKAFASSEDGDQQLMSLSEGRRCNDEESEQLDGIFPGFREKCWAENTQQKEDVV